ncbi:MAG: hypothetical protein CME70_02470 [Halobacteriovorax sp.]|nr:hypothetical protein [Halobacteriovorax sp.]|tara:strand:+ start:23028 stop:23606 length:579 start_codon:yes stop_codon:yes gene_type:complete
MSITILLTFLFIFSSCSRFQKLNSVEGRLRYDEHYATFNNIDYESEETEEFGFGITGKDTKKGKKGIEFSYSIFPDIALESSKLFPSHPDNRTSFGVIETKRFSGFLSGRGSMFTPVGAFEISAGAGLSYIDASGVAVSTSKIEPTFRYTGSYTLFFLEWLYGGVQFTFQESPQSTFSEYYSLSYNLGLVFR